VAEPAEADPPEVLRLDGVRKSYNAGTPQEIEVLHGIDLVLARGEFAALVGPSGSGKSTLLNIIGLLDRPSAGHVVIEGHDTTGLDDASLTRLRGHSIGFVFQHHHLIGAFSAVENVMMPALLDRGRPDAAMRDAAEALLDQVGLYAWKDRPVGTLSGGQQQRVAVARALAMAPALVLADEPTGNLDTKSADGVFALMRAMNRASATTFLVVTHDPRLAQRCDRIIEVVDGNVVADQRVATPEPRGDEAEATASPSA
jgi:lipoprotein-releasing system ATP-binding protein